MATTFFLIAYEQLKIAQINQLFQKLKLKTPPMS